MSLRTKIFTAYENPEQEDPADRIELVREGFSLGAFLFTVFWLLYHRLWLAAAGYMVLLSVIIYAAETFGVSKPAAGMLQLLLQVLLGFTAFDLQRLQLHKKGYRFAGVLAAETPLNAARRYYDVMA